MDDMNENLAIGSKCSRRNDQDFKRQPGHRCSKNLSALEEWTTSIREQKKKKKET